MDDKARANIGVIGCVSNGRTTLVQAIANSIRSEDVDKDLTWGDIKKDFDAIHPNTAALVDDWRPYSAFMIQLWLKTGGHITYNYLSKSVQNI